MKNRPKILVVGSLVMDLIVGTERFPERGETVIGHSFHTAPGGKGANQAVQAAHLGADVSFVGMTGADDFGRQLRDSVAAAGIDISRVLTDPFVPTAIGNIQLETGGKQTQNRICVVPGANMRITPNDIVFLENEIRQYDMVILQLEIPLEINLLVARYARSNNVPVMLNAAPYAALPAELLKNLTYISPNEHEASDVSGIRVTDLESAQAAAKKIHAMGVPNVLITLGHRGAALYDGKDFIFRPAVSGVQAVDPTAAGDSFVGAFCTAVCSGLSAPDALVFANHTAALTVTRMGAMPSLPHLEEVQDFLKEKEPSWPK